MPRTAWLLVAVFAGRGFLAGENTRRDAPAYATASIVNSASNQGDQFAPNTLITIYGTNLAYVSKAVAPADIQGGKLPTILPGTGVTVYINRIRTQIYYVSPNQINILVPSDFRPGKATLEIALDGVWGPAAAIELKAAAPALFEWDNGSAIAVHADASLLSRDAPGRPGEMIVLYATGLGETTPLIDYGEIPTGAAPIKDPGGTFRVLLDGVPVDPDRVAYAGVSPGFAGLYQINVRLPAEFPAEPEVRLVASGQVSKAGVVLHARP